MVDHLGCGVNVIVRGNESGRCFFEQGAARLTTLHCSQPPTQASVHDFPFLLGGITTARLFQLSPHGNFCVDAPSVLRQATGSSSSICASKSSSVGASPTLLASFLGISLALMEPGSDQKLSSLSASMVLRRAIAKLDLFLSNTK